MTQRWQSLWTGPDLSDGAEYCDGSVTCYGMWLSTRLYALDFENRAWTLCRHSGAPLTRWVLVDDLVSGVAARAWLAERERGE